MSHWTVQDFIDAMGVTRRKAQALYDAWQCEDYEVRG